MRTDKHDYPRNDNQENQQTGDTRTYDRLSICHFTNIVLEISTLLLESGAHCERINRNIQRMAANTPYKVEMLLSFTAVSISVFDKNNPRNIISANRRVKHHGAHFGILTETSLLTWQLFDRKITFAGLAENIEILRNATKHPVWLVRFFIGIACGCLCLLSGGGWIDGVYAFVASFAGLIVRQEMVKHGFNLMVSITCSAFVTTIISGMDILLGFGSFPASSVATAVLFLIPGVPLINSIIDLIEGYIPTGLARGAFGGFILLCIAVGMFLGMMLIGINKF
jgi:uncharacterized membrane protein YjjP (DUF1212 family)